MPSELKPCPHCGGEAELDTDQSYRALSDGSLGSRAVVYCTRCGADMGFCYEDSRGAPREDIINQVVDDWNRRVSSVAERAEGEAIQARHLTLEEQKTFDAAFKAAGTTRQVLPLAHPSPATVGVKEWTDEQIGRFTEALCAEDIGDPLRASAPRLEALARHVLDYVFRSALIPSPSAPAAVPGAASAQDPLEWAIERWNAEVRNRPLKNVHRRALDTTWRQVIRHFGGDADACVGPSHDDLVAEHPEEFREPTIATAPSVGEITEAIMPVLRLAYSCGYSDRPGDLGWSDNIERLRAALTAALSGCRVAEGWKAVPVEPTEAMIDAGAERIVREYSESDWEEAKDMAESLNPAQVWSAMLSACPAAPTQEGA